MTPTLVTIPTLNEAAGILSLLDAIFAAVPEVDVLVIDDASPDRTRDLVQQRSLKDARVSLIERPARLGVGSAYMAGFAYAMQRGFRQVITMDADFAHPPARLPALIAALDAGADLAIGSRYARGGTVEGWAWPRRLGSAAANRLARLMLRLRTRDCTGGFRAYRRRLLEFLIPRPLRSCGYSALLELLARCERGGFAVVEIPIQFVDHGRGRSRISRLEILRAAVTLMRLSRERP